VLFSFLVSARLPLVLCIRLLKEILSFYASSNNVVYVVAQPCVLYCLYDVLTLFLLSFRHGLTETCEIVVVGLADQTHHDASGSYLIR